MPEVDYSRFVYEREKEEITEPRLLRKDKKKSGGNVLFVIVTVIICFALVILAVDIFSNGKIASSVSASLRKNDYEYYVVATEKQDKGAAYSKSMAVKQGGGAGYVFTDGKKIYVFYSVFYNEADAKAVAAKNPDTTVLSFGRKGKNAFYSELDRLFAEFCALVTGYDDGTVTDSEFSGGTSKIKESLVALMNDDKYSSDAEKRALCEYLIKGTEELKTTRIKTDFLSGARYFMSGWAVSVCN